MMTNGDHGNGFFYPVLTRIMYSFLAHLIPHLYLKKIEQAYQKILNTLRCNMVTSFQHYNGVTDHVRTACGYCFLSFPKTGTGMREKQYLTWVKTTEIPIWCARTISLKHVVSGFLKVMVQSVLFSTALWCRYKHQFTLTDTSDYSILNNESEKSLKFT